ARVARWDSSRSSRSRCRSYMRTPVDRHRLIELFHRYWCQSCYRLSGRVSVTSVPTGFQRGCRPIPIQEDTVTTPTATTGVPMRLTINGERLWASLMELAAIGAHHDEATGLVGVNRQSLTDEDAAGRRLLIQW